MPEVSRSLYPVFVKYLMVKMASSGALAGGYQNKTRTRCPAKATHIRALDSYSFLTASSRLTVLKRVFNTELPVIHTVV